MKNVPSIEDQRQGHGQPRLVDMYGPDQTDDKRS